MIVQGELQDVIHSRKWLTGRQMNLSPLRMLGKHNSLGVWRSPLKRFSCCRGRGWRGISGGRWQTGRRRRQWVSNPDVTGKRRWLRFGSRGCSLTGVTEVDGRRCCRREVRENYSVLTFLTWTRPIFRFGVHSAKAFLQVVPSSGVNNYYGQHHLAVYK